MTTQQRNEIAAAFATDELKLTDVATTTFQTTDDNDADENEYCDMLLLTM